jgi:mono/diheme cytochrome c family protein
MSKIGRRSVRLIMGVMLLAACAGGDDEQGQPRPTAADLAPERMTQVPLVGATVTPFPPPLSTAPADDEETPPTPTPPTTPGVSPTPITPQPAGEDAEEAEAEEAEAEEAEAEEAEAEEAEAEEAEAEEPAGTQSEAEAGAHQASRAAPVQVEVVFVTPAPDGFASTMPKVPIEVSVVVLPSTNQAQEEESAAGAGASESQATPAADGEEGEEAAGAGEDEGAAADDEEEPGGEEGGSQAGVGVRAAPPQDVDAYLAAGAHVYTQRCAACHGPDGVGRREFFPNLRDNPILTVEDPDGIIALTLHGRNLMPPFRSRLSDEEIAAAISFLRNAWGHEADLVMPEDVTRVRQAPLQSSP